MIRVKAKKVVWEGRDLLQSVKIRLNLHQSDVKVIHRVFFTAYCPLVALTAENFELNVVTSCQFRLEISTDVQLAWHSVLDLCMDPIADFQVS